MPTSGRLAALALAGQMATACVGYKQVNQLTPTAEEKPIPTMRVHLKSGQSVWISFGRVTQDSIVGFKEWKRMTPMGVALADVVRVERTTISATSTLSVIAFIGVIYVRYAI